LASGATKKKEFLHTLRTLPKWDRTTLWCRSLALKPVSPVDKPSRPFILHKNEGLRQTKSIPGNDHRSLFAKQAWSRMTDYFADRVKEVKARWPLRLWPRGKKNRDIGDEID
jgi:hypothetical protein